MGVNIVGNSNINGNVVGRDMNNAEQWFLLAVEQDKLSFDSVIMVFGNSKDEVLTRYSIYLGDEELRISTVPRGKNELYYGEAGIFQIVVGKIKKGIIRP